MLLLSSQGGRFLCLHFHNKAYQRMNTDTVHDQKNKKKKKKTVVEEAEIYHWSTTTL